MKLLSPKDTEIIGTLEIVCGVAGLLPETLRFAPKTGIFVFDYDGETKIDWNSQATVVRDGERIFVDREGNEFKESELRLV